MPCTMMARRPRVSPGIRKRVRERTLPVIQQFQVRKNKEIEKELKSFQNGVERRLRETEVAVIQAQQQVQQERLKLMEDQTRLMQEVSGLSEEVKDLAEPIHALSALLKQREQQAVTERRQILNNIQEAKALARKNQARLDENATILREGMRTILTSIQDIENRRELQEMSSAANMIERVVMLQGDVAAETKEKFRDERYDQALRDLEQANRLFKKRRFQAALKLAGNAHLTMSEFAARAKKQQSEFENEQYMALESLARLDGLMDSMDDDIGRAWYPGQIDNLKKKRAALESLLEQSTTQAYRRLKDTADDMQHQEMKLWEKIETRIEQDETRMQLMEQITRSLESMFYHTMPPVLEKPYDLSSDLVLMTEEGLKVALGIEGDVVLNFENPQDTIGNREKLKQLGHFLAQNQAERIEIDFEHVPHDRMIKEGPYQIRKPEVDLRKKLVSRA